MLRGLRLRFVARVGSLALGLGSAVAFGCYSGPEVDTNRAPDPRTDIDETDPTTDGGTDLASDASAHTPRGVPCEVAAVVATSCMQCHGAVPSGGAKNRLLTYEDFAAKPTDSSFASVAALALSRLKSSTRPMPPDGNVDKSSITAFSHWVSQGLPRGTCAEQPADDAGAPDLDVDDDDGGAVPDPPVSTCTSDVMLPEPDPTQPASYSELMKPGAKCNDCHAQNEGPLLEIAGTVFPTAHEPENCTGAADITVLILDASGFVHTLTTNASGNFTLPDQFPRPYRALVIHKGNVREMQTPQTNGDCNSCHTEFGDQGAPGRINIP